MFGHFGNETIADTGNGQDITLTFMAVAENLAQKKDVLAEISLFHKAVWPDGVQEFRLFNNPAAVVDQEEQHFKGFRREGQRLQPMREHALVAVQLEGTEIAEALCLLRHTVILRTLRRP